MRRVLTYSGWLCVVIDRALSGARTGAHMRVTELRRAVWMASLAALVTVLGCGSMMKTMSGHMSPEKAAQYSQLSPPEFVKTRFYTEERSSIGDALSSPEMELTRAGLSPDGSVQLPAYYNDVNYYQLTRPEQNLRTYCERRGGQWALLDAYDMRKSVGMAYAEGRGASGLRSAKQQGAFGEFTCKSPQETWYAWVYPGVFFPAQGGPDPMARLIIRALSSEERARLKEAEDMRRENARAQEEQQRAMEAERVETLRLRGQTTIDRVELGARLCKDIQVGQSMAVVSAFLENVRGENVQLRVNNVVSPDGTSVFTLSRPIDGVLYTDGNVIWSERRTWRACD